MTLGRKIRNRRTELGMTQPELAAASKLTQGYISRVERGDYIPRAGTLLILSMALQMPYDELLSEAEQSKDLMKQQVS